MIIKFKVFENDDEYGEDDFPYPDSLYVDDDYVMLHSGFFLNDEFPNEHRGMVIDMSYSDDEGWYYDLVLVNSTLAIGVLEFGIERELTDEEIEQVEIEKNANKFNL
jgi:hypothetical protein